MRRRRKHARRCRCPVPAVLTAPGPPRLIGKGLFTTEFCVNLLVVKYALGLPFNRVIAMLAMAGLETAAGTLAGVARRLGGLLAPVAGAIAARNVGAGHAHADETSWRVFDEPADNGGGRWWLRALLAADCRPLNRTGVEQILTEEGFGRLLRHPDPEASISPATAGRDTRLSRAKVIDFAAFPAVATTRLAGLLLAVPDLAALDLPALARAAGYPGTKVIPATSWLLSLLALKLTATRRVSHVDDLLDDPASALFAGLATLPKKSALTDYSCRLSHDHWGHDPAQGSTTCPPVLARPLRADLLRPRLANPQPALPFSTGPRTWWMPPARTVSCGRS